MAGNTAPAAQRVPQPRPYRDFLTPSLHRRFRNTVLVGLAACWVEAILMSEPSLFWSWFPLGFTGIRALLLFVSALAVFILRVAQLHFGARTTTSPLQTFWQYGLGWNTLQTAFWYLTSAFLFSEVYIFSTAQSANLAWVDPGRSYERPRMNERPVLFRSLFYLLAIAQSALHLYRDYDRVVMQQNVKEVPQSPDGKTELVVVPKSALTQLQAATTSMVQNAISLVIVTTLSGPFVYFVFIRSAAWSLAFGVGRTFFSIPKAVKPSGLTDLTTLIFRFAWASLLLALLWELSNQIFTIYTAQDPVKKGQPLTAESKDPNGSLISGLRAKKTIPRTMAFWELSTITAAFEGRRKTIYQDIDRRGGSTWTQVSNICLAEIQSISQRVQDFQQPATTASDQAGAQAESIQKLPKISQPLKQDNILTAPAPPASGLQLVAGGVGTLAKHYGQSPSPNPLGANAQKLLEYGSSKVLTEQQQEQLSRSKLTTQANGYVVRLLRSPLGFFFRQSFSRRVNAVVFDSPYSRAKTISHAVQSICRLAVCSLREDSLGQVQKDVATIIRVLVSTIQNVQIFIQTLPPHWTDVEFDGKRQARDAEELLDVMRSGLEQLLSAFGEYADTIGLSRTEMRIAKDVARRGHEMEMKQK
ncbi:hypothetical protein MBLNU459_g6068t1 [Dothideomycetes sp. NU459]